MLRRRAERASYFRGEDSVLVRLTCKEPLAVADRPHFEARFAHAGLAHQVAIASPTELRVQLDGVQRVHLSQLFRQGELEIALSRTVVDATEPRGRRRTYCFASGDCEERVLEATTIGNADVLEIRPRVDDLAAPFLSLRLTPSGDDRYLKLTQKGGLHSLIGTLVDGDLASMDWVQAPHEAGTDVALALKVTDSVVQRRADAEGISLAVQKPVTCKWRLAE